MDISEHFSSEELKNYVRYALDDFWQSPERIVSIIRKSFNLSISRLLLEVHVRSALVNMTLEKEVVSKKKNKVMVYRRIRPSEQKELDLYFKSKDIPISPVCPQAR